MKALILNSGLGSRMGTLTSKHPKCMTSITGGDTILSRQLRLLAQAGIHEVVITTGPYADCVVSYCESLGLPLQYCFIQNPLFRETNYIYSIYLARHSLQDDLIFMHGDLVFEASVLEDMLMQKESSMAVSTSVPLPEKDFKAVLDAGRIKKVGIEFFEQACAAQPLYKLLKRDWLVWMSKIEEYCECGKRNCYAENALNEVSGQCRIRGFDVGERLCREIDTVEDLFGVRKLLSEARVEMEEQMKKVYVCLSTDILHGGHINIIRQACKLGEVTVGLLSDEAIIDYKHYPLLSYKERKEIVENIKGVSHVVEQKELSYSANLRKYRPDIVIHGDNWKTGIQAPIRAEVIEVLKEYGGELVEIPYSTDESYRLLEETLSRLSIPDIRRGRLRQLLKAKRPLSILEAHSGITGLIAEKTQVFQNGKTRQFDGMWVSSLCDSTAKGKPDIELVDMSSRMRTVDDIMEVTTKPIILDGDTGGMIEHFVYTVRTLERMGVSAVIIEDKTGLKKNSLFGTEVEQTQDSIEHFSAKIAAGKKAQRTKEFMIIARIESLILERGMEDALTRAAAFVEAGADGIMIHSRKKEPDEIFEFVKKFRQTDKKTPLVVVPTSFNTVTEDEFGQRGVNIVIYANQLTRSGFPAMQKTAETILTTHRAKEADDACMPIREILTLIPEESAT